MSATALAARFAAASGVPPAPVTPLERTLQFTVAAMAALGTFVLGVGQQSMLLPVVAITVAVSSVWLTDILGVLRLNRNVANCAAILAVLISVADFYRLERDSQLLSIANLLIYLQVVLMYQRKETRIYWQLLMLSLLQVVVAAALNFGLMFGVLLVVYLFLGLFALRLFFIYREQERVARLRDDLDLLDENPAVRRLRERRASLLVVKQASPASDEVLDRRLYVQALQQGALTLAMAGLFFFIAPRLGQETWSNRGPRMQRVVGFSEKVELGSLGAAFENPAAVMRVQFSDLATDAPFRVEGEPLFRGAVVDYYENGGWRHYRRRFQHDPSPPPYPPQRAGLVRQDITLEGLNEETVFAVYPAYRLSSRDLYVRYDENKEQLIRLGHASRSEIALATSGFDGHRLREVIPLERRLSGDEEARLMELPNSRQEVGEPLPRLARFAAETIAQTQLPTNDRIGRAQALNARLRDSGEFGYSLQGIRRDPTLDPIEDFVSANRLGHCEYFSSALTLMLRTQSIPARMVIGFKGGEYNSVGQFYQVRQLHAHSWVEVYLAPQHLPAGLLPEGEGRYGAWLQLDPTPGGPAEADVQAGWTESIREWIDYGEYLWSHYVVGLDQRRQRESIYQPVEQAVQDAVSPAAWKSRAQAAGVWWREQFIDWWARNWFTWRGALAMLGIVGVLSGGVWLGRRWWQRFDAARRARQLAAPSGRGRTIEFYRRLEATLARYGLRRAPGQTQYEFAVQVGGLLADEPGLAPSAALPRKVAEAFYRVRFGGESLSGPEEAHVENALNQLARALAQHHAVHR